MSNGLISIRITAVCLALFAIVGHAAAAPDDAEPLRIELTAPASCPASPTLLERVRAHTSRVRDAAPGERARELRATVVAKPGGFDAEIHLTDEDGSLERRLSGTQCEEVLAAVALITALTIDAHAAAASAPTPIDAGEDAPEARDAGTTVVRRVDPSPTPVTMVPARIGLRLGTSLEADGLGKLVLGRAIWAEGVLPCRMMPSVRVRLAESRSFEVAPQRLPAYFRLTTATVETCVVALGSPAWQLRPCLDLTGGVLEGASSAVAPTRHTVRGWAAPGAMLQGRWGFFGPLALELAGGLSIPIIRDDFFFLPRIDAYRAPPVVFVGNLGVSTTFR